MTCSAMDVEDVHNVLSVMQKNLECPICLDLMKEPVATRCDHIFCRFCMLQLLSKKKKGRAQCPMCKKEVTRRSLQDSPRFKLLVDGLLKIINAFELDSGYKFFPSQDYASTGTTNHKEAPKKDEQPVVQSTGYRNRSKRGIVNGGLLSLLETSADTQLARDVDALNCSRQKKETEQLITDFVSDCSEDDLFKKAGSLGSNVDEPYLSGEPREAHEPEEKEDSLMADEANDQVSSKLESEDVAASDLAEYGFSEKDIDSIRSNLLSIDGVTHLKESPSENSAEVRDPLLFDKDFCGEIAEQSTLVKLDEDARNSKRKEPNSNMPIERQHSGESQTLKIAIDYQYDRDDSTPENMASTQGSPKDVPHAVSREQVKKSIRKVNEWFLKTHELLNFCSSGDDKLLPDISMVDNQDASDKGSHVSDETEIMAVSHCHVAADNVEKNMVSVEDKIFGRVYKREKKSTVTSKVTCVADVHVDGVVNASKVNEVPKAASVKPKRSIGLQPEDFIKKFEEQEQNTDLRVSGSVIVDDFGLDMESNQLKAPNAVLLNADKIEAGDQDLETDSGALLSKSKRQRKPLKRKSEKTQRARMMQSLHLTMRADACQQQSPFHSSEVKIDSYSSSTELAQEVNQKNVRRSKRLNVFKENDLLCSANQAAIDKNSKDIRNGRQQPEGPPSGITTTLNNCEEPGLHVTEGHGPKITNQSPTAIQNVTDGQNESSQMVPVYVTEGTGKGSSSIPEHTAEKIGNAAEMEDSDLDTQLLLKTFKSAKRMSFKLDPVTEPADNKNCDPMDICDVMANVRNGQQNKDGKGQPDEDLHCANQCKSASENQPEPLMNLRSKSSYRFSSEHSERRSAENTDNLSVHTTEDIRTDSQLNDLNPINDGEPLETCNRDRNAALSKSEGPPLLLETESMFLSPVVTHQNPAAARQGDTKSEIGQEENEQARNSSYQKCSFDEEQVNQITSFNSSQGSMTEKLLDRSTSRNSSPNKSPEVNSDTPDGLLGSVDRFRENTSCCAVAEKSFVFGDGKKPQLVDRSVSPVSQSQVVRSRKRRAQKLESSEEESSGDEDLPCFNGLFCNASSIAEPKNASASSSPKQQGGGVLAMFSSCSTSGKTQTSFNLPREALVCSQESVNLFSSQSNTSDHSLNGTIDQNSTRSQHQTQKSSPKRAKVEVFFNEEMTNVENEQEVANVEDDCEDPCQDQKFGEVSGCESEASHTGDSSGLSSQCEILNTQQRDAMRNNLEKLQREMAALEAVLEQHGCQSPSARRVQASTAEQVTVRPQEAPEKRADYEPYRSPDAIPETVIPSAPDRALGQPPPSGSRSRSPTPPLSLPQATRKETPEIIRASFNVLKESTVTEDVSAGQREDDVVHAHEPATINLANSESPKRNLQTVNGHGTVRRRSSRKSTDLKEVVQTPQHSSRHPGNTQRSSSPTFTSPLRSKFAPSVKSPVVSGKRNFSLVTSGLSQSEMIMVQKFSRKTQSIFTNQMTESTTHVIMKTDEQLVCERTLKYFLGIAGRKWVISYEWIVQSFREGRILDEYDFEVKGDVINGRNHRGPRRSRLGSDGLLLTDFEICCFGSFKDLTRDDLEWMVSLCGASVAHDPSQFEHKSGKTSLVVVQPDKKTDYAAMRRKHHCLVITREWVLDSVSSYKLQAFDTYLA